MRIKDILSEAHKEVDIDWVHKNCSEAIEHYKQGHIIYRGDKLSIQLKQFVLMTPHEKPREAAYASNNLHNEIINTTKEFTGFPKREIIMTTSADKADNYGGIMIALPVNGANIGIVPSDDIFDAFRHIHSSIQTFYHTIQFGFLADVRKWTDGSFYSMASTNKVFRDIHENATQEELDMIVDDLINVRSNSPTYEYREMLVKCIRQGNGAHIFSLFTSDGFEHVPLSEFKAKEDHEVWTDSPVVMLNRDDIELIISGNT